MSEPLKNPRHEAFALAIANGHKLQRAHELAGFKPDRKTAWVLRHRPDVSRRVDEILKHRAEADSRSFAKRQKKHGALLDRALAKLDDIMSTDVREIMDWRREPILNADGEVIDIAESVAVRDAASISPKAASAIKGVFLKSGRVRLELHDQRAAAAEIVKLLRGADALPKSVNVTQINVGQVSALEVAKRVHFLLAAARHAQAAAPAAPVIDAAPVHKSEDAEVPTAF